MTYRGAAREAYYAYYPKKAEDLHAIIDRSDRRARTIALQVEELFNVFRRGVDRFWEETDRDQELAQLAEERGRKFLMDFRPEDYGLKI